MNGKNPTCFECSCNEMSRTIERHGRNLIMEEINFSCGAHRKETFTSDVKVGKVESLGCKCAR